MSASNPGSKAWWSVVQTTEHHEADRMLRDYKASLLAHNVGKDGYIAAGAEIAKINAEIHRLAQLAERCSFRKAIMNVCGGDVLAQVCAERVRLEVEARAELGMKPC